jgi:Niemann-Pick C1 protein
MKIFLGLAGVTLVLLSVFSSGGFFTYLGVPATLITLEVIPFLLLAVGVDNIYVMVQTYQNDERLPEENIENQIARIVGKVGPSMLLTGTTQSCAFLISALTPMPGVRAFSLYASLAIILNFLMQITCFVVLLTLDAKREASKRIDVAFCVKLNLNEAEEINRSEKSSLHRFFKNYYSRILLNDYVRASIIVLFVGFFCACLGMCNKLKVGLNQKLPMPSDSYQIDYFDALQKYLAVGPPVYFVLKDGYNYTDIDSLRRLCGSPACESNSLQSLISSASFFPNETFIAQSSVNWIDDYLEWLNANPSFSSCCHVFRNTTNFCDIKRLTEESSKLADDCVPCPVDRIKYDFPSKDTFLKYSNHFLHQNPSRDCVKAGHAMYGNAVKLHKDDKDNILQIGCKLFNFYTLRY